jgi:hypothetical protein
MALAGERATCVFAADPFTFIKFATEHQETAGCAGKQLVFRHPLIGKPGKNLFCGSRGRNRLRWIDHLRAF